MSIRFSDTASRYKGVRVLVLGATGFIGHWVALALATAGGEVSIAVRDRERWKKLSKSSEPVNLKEIDLLDRRALSSLITNINPTVIFNLAGYGVDRMERDESTAWRMNAVLPLTIGEILAEQDIGAWDGQRFVHAGSALEYGRCSGDLSENTEPAPTTVYGRSKLAGTWALQDVSRSIGFQSAIARLFTVYGPGEHEGRLLPSLVEAAHNETDVCLTDGTQKRDFTYVDDVVEGLLRIGLSNAPPGEIINLATGRLTTVRIFAETAADVLKILPTRLRFGALPIRNEEMAHNPVSTKRLQLYTGWRPSISIRDGIRRALLPDTARAHSE